MADEPGLKVGLVAGETSGDLLGAGLLQAMHSARPDIHAVGVAGDAMIAARCQPLIHASELAVMGLFEVVAHLPRLLQIRRGLMRQFLAWKPDVFVGIDAPDFNLGMESRMKRHGIPTVHFVSPSVWAWRSGRVAKIARSADLVLCLLPFEKQFYDRHNVRAEFVGHPLAEQLAQGPDRTTARRKLGLADEGEWLALLPGSRNGEVTRLARDFAETLAWLREKRPAMRFIAALASAEAESIFEARPTKNQPATTGPDGTRPVTHRDGCSGCDPCGLGNRHPGSGVDRPADGGDLPFGPGESLAFAMARAVENRTFLLAKPGRR